MALALRTSGLGLGLGLVLLGLDLGLGLDIVCLVNITDSIRTSVVTKTLDAETDTKTEAVAYA